MIKQLAKLANHLDSKGLRKEADYLDKIILKLSEEKMPQFEPLELSSPEPEEDASEEYQRYGGEPETEKRVESDFYYSIWDSEHIDGESRPNSTAKEWLRYKAEILASKAPQYFFTMPVTEIDVEGGEASYDAAGSLPELFPELAEATARNLAVASPYLFLRIGQEDWGRSYVDEMPNYEEAFKKAEVKWPEYFKSVTHEQVGYAENSFLVMYPELFFNAVKKYAEADYESFKSDFYQRDWMWYLLPELEDLVETGVT